MRGSVYRVMGFGNGNWSWPYGGVRCVATGFSFFLFVGRAGEKANQTGRERQGTSVFGDREKCMRHIYVDVDVE